MEMRADLLIVGAGMVGSALALALQDSGLEVLLLDGSPLSVKPFDAQAPFEPRVSALSAASQVNQLLSSTMGVRGQQKYRLLERELIVNGSLAWRQLQGDLRPEMELSLAEGQTFRVQGTRLPNSSLLLDLHADYALAPGVGLDIRYKGMTGSGSEGNAVSVSVRWRM